MVSSGQLLSILLFAQWLTRLTKQQYAQMRRFCCWNGMRLPRPFWFMSILTIQSCSGVIYWFKNSAGMFILSMTYGSCLTELFKAFLISLKKSCCCWNGRLLMMLAAWLAPAIPLLKSPLYWAWEFGSAIYQIPLAVGAMVLMTLVVSLTPCLSPFMKSPKLKSCCCCWNGSCGRYIPDGARMLF